MEFNLFYVSFEGDKNSIDASVTKSVHRQLMQEKVCIPLPEKNWIVITDKSMDTLQKTLYDSTDSDALYVYKSSGFDILAKKIPNLMPAQEQGTAELRQELHDMRDILLDLMKKNGSLIEENTALRLAQMEQKE